MVREISSNDKPSMADADPAANGKASASARIDAAVAIMAAQMAVLTTGRQVTELRGLNYQPSQGAPHNVAGFFDAKHLAEMASEAMRITGRCSPGVYFTLNSVDESLLARRCNRIDRAKEGEQVADKCITRLNWLLIDIDPNRDSKISSTDEEKAVAFEVAKRIRAWLRARGWPDPILADSGNGYALLYRIDLTRDKSTLLKSVLEALAFLFDCDGATVDQTVHNPGRIWKVPGTLARKGDDCPDLGRPHRRAYLMEIPGCPDTKKPDTPKIEVVTEEQLQVIALPPAPAQPQRGVSGTKSRLLVDRWLSDRGREYTERRATRADGRTVYRLGECPFDSSHRSPDAAIMQDGSGALSFHCFHNSCRGRTWQVAKEAIGKPGPEHYDPPLSSNGHSGSSSNGHTWSSTTQHTPAGGGASAALPQITVNNRQLADVTDDAHAAILTGNTIPKLFSRAGRLVRIRQDQDGGIPALELMGENSMRGHMARVATWVEVKTPKGCDPQVTQVFPPPGVVKDYLALPAWLDLPALDAIVDVPVYDRECRLVQTPGYNSDARIYYHQSITIPAVSVNPTREEIDEAKALLLVELYGDFPFVGDPDKAHALAMLLLGFIRRAIDGPTPLHVVSAPSEGSGKSLLTEVALLPFVGKVPDATPEASTEDEWRKRIFSMLLEASPIIWFDNLNKRLDSGALAAALTSTTFKDRILSTSSTASVPNQAEWIITGNNPTMSREMVRRSISSRIDSKMENPAEDSTIKYKHTRLLQWAKENRAKLVWAALTLCQAWIAAGKPSGTATLGKFEVWSEVMGGILDVAKVTGFLGNAKEFRARSTDQAGEWFYFVDAWHMRYQCAAVGVKDLFDLAKSQDLLEEVLGEGEDRSQRTRLGMALSKQRDRVIGRCRIEAGDPDNSARLTYRLAIVHSDAPPEPPAPASTIDDPSPFGEHV